jgi:hypothetical protein
MEQKKALKINLSDLCEAIDNNSLDYEHFLDLETGEILFVSDYMDDEETAGLKDRIEENFKRYERIPEAGSNQGYQDMVDFIDTVDDERLVELLEVAIDGKGAFRRFKDVLLNYPDERERWFRFKDEKIEQRAMKWLEDINVTLSEEQQDGFERESG